MAEKMPELSYDKNAALRRYHSALFTQLVLNGLSVQAAASKTNEAVDYLTKLEVAPPEINVG